VCGDGLVKLPLGAQDVTEVVVARGIVGLEADGLAQFGFRTSVVAFPVTQNGPEVVVGQDAVGFEADGHAVFGDGLVKLPLVPQGIAEPDLGKLVVRFEADPLTGSGHGRFQGLAGFPGQPLLFERKTQAAQMPRVVRP
jgi:hypothetical protein